jgi:hypothetical protein
MNSKLTLLFVLVFIILVAAQADTVAVNFVAYPSVFPDPNESISLFSVGISNLADQTIYLSLAKRNRVVGLNALTPGAE